MTGSQGRKQRKGRRRRRAQNKMCPPANLESSSSFDFQTHHPGHDMPTAYSGRSDELGSDEEIVVSPPADIYQSCDLRNLLRGKTVVFMGDSNMRALYKDLVCLSQDNKLLSLNNLKVKVHETFYGDKLVAVNSTKGRSFIEERQFLDPHFQMYYAFLTRIYSDYVNGWLEKFQRYPPDILVINSCLWDIARWGPNGVQEYKENLVKFFDQLKNVLPGSTLVIWLTVPPLSQKMNKGFLVPQLKFLELSLRLHVMEANKYAATVVSQHGFDVLDIHYFLRLEVSLRQKDGIHWLPRAVRLISCLLLTYIARSFGVCLPQKFQHTISQREDFSYDLRLENEDDFIMDTSSHIANSITDMKEDYF